MEEQGTMVGRVLQASTTAFTAGRSQTIAEQRQGLPEFGALVRVAAAMGQLEVYGLICNVSVQDDAFVRQLVAAGIDDSEIIADQRQNRQVPVIAEVLVVGYRREAKLLHRLPPQPPSSLECVYECPNAELVRFTEAHDWMRLILASKEAVADELLAAAVRNASVARPVAMREGYLLSAGRELARLLAQELPRLDPILKQLKD